MVDTWWARGHCQRGGHVDAFKGVGTWWTLSKGWARGHLKGWARGGHVDTFKGVGHVVDTWTLVCACFYDVLLF